MSDWLTYHEGATLGAKGAEGGAIVRDEEHPDGARITLERETLRGVPFAITCGVYGLLAHTRFFADEPTAVHEFARMQGALEALLCLMPDDSDGDIASAADAAEDAAAAFIEQFP